MSLPTSITDDTTQHEDHHEVLHAIANRVLTPEIFEMMRAAKDTFGNRPSPGDFPSLFLPTSSGGAGIVANSLEFDNGSAWVKLWNLMQDAEWDFTASGNAAKVIVPSAGAKMSGDQSINAGAEETLTWGTQQYDNDGLYASGSLMTASRHAIWGIGTWVVWDSDADGDSATSLLTRMLKNGADVIAGDRRKAVASAQVPLYTELELAEGDDIRVTVQRPSVVTGATFIKDVSRFYMKLVTDL